MSVFLNSDGPVTYSESIFRNYQQAFPNLRVQFDDLYHYWLNEANPADLRRLALRDLLRQDFSDQSPYPHYQTGMSFGRLPVLLRGTEHLENYPALHYRPQLVEELTEELLYAVQHKRIHGGYRAVSDVNALVRIIIPFVSEPTGRELLAIHSVWKDAESPPEETYNLLHAIVDPVLPDWLHVELWHHLQATCRKEINARRKDIEKADSLFDLSGVQKPIRALQETSRFIGLYSVDTNHHNYAPLTPILDFLNTKLPLSFSYSLYHEAAVIAPRLTDDKVAYEYARRHVLGVKRDTITPSDTDRRFLYWFYGLAAHFGSLDDGLIPRINDLLAKATESQPTK